MFMHLFKGPQLRQPLDEVDNMALALKKLACISVRHFSLQLMWLEKIIFP